MKVLYYALIEPEIPGGPTVHTLNVLKGFQEIGIQTLLICPKPKKAPIEIIPGAVHFIRFFGFSPFRLFIFDLLSFFALVGEIIRFRPDVIYIREMEGNLLMTFAAWFCRVPVFIDVNGPFNMDYVQEGKEYEIGLSDKKGIERLVICAWRKIWRRIQFFMASGLTFNTKGWRDKLIQEFNYPKEKTCVITMFVDTHRFFPMSREDCRKQAGLLPHKVILGYVGSFQPTYDLDILFKALEWLVKKGFDAELLLAGGGNQMKAYEGRFAESPLKQRIHFKGWVPHVQIPILVNACDIGISIIKSVKSYAAEAPLKMKEFLACGVPVVIDSNPELFMDYPREGIAFVNAGDIESVGTGMLRLLELERPKALLSSIQFIRDRFCLKRCAEETQSFFTHLSGKAF